MKYVLFFLTVLLGFAGAVQAQVANTGLLDTTGGEKVENLRIGGYVDTYYGYFSRTGGGKTVPFFVSQNRQNEFAINLAYADFRYSHGRIRARFVPAFGSYMRSNYSSEPEGFRYLLEASGGYCLSEKRRIWVDMGLLGSPFSNESPVSRDQMTFSRSLAPEYVPYYLSGVRISLPLGRRWIWYGYLVNGWQQIQDVNSLKSVVSQLEFRPDSFNLITWNMYAGSERNLAPGFGSRFFTDFYWIYRGKGRWSFSSCVYMGYQEKDGKVRRKERFWGQANAAARFRMRKNHHLAGRLEYFHDPGSTVVPAWNGKTGERFRAGSASLGWDCSLSPEALFRMEFRQFVSPDRIFPAAGNTQVSHAWWLLSGIAVSF